MKNGRLVLAIVCAASMAASCSGLAQDSSERPSKQTGDQRQNSVSAARTAASRIGANHGTPDTFKSDHSTVRPLLKGSVASTSTGAHTQAFHARQVSPGAMSPNQVRHRGSNPAVVGGSSTSEDRGTGSLNGSRMPRRP